MPSTVNKRCVVYILAKRVRSQTVSRKFLWILLNKGYIMLNNTKNLRWYCKLWNLCMGMTLLTICQCRCFGDCNFWKEISSKSKIWFPVKLFDIWIPQTVTCQKLEAKLLRYTFAKHEIAYWKHVLHWNRKEMKNVNPGIIAWRLLDIFEKCTENENLQFSNLRFLRFFLFKSMKSTKNPQNSILCTPWHNLYTKHRKWQQLFELAYKLKYYVLLFVESILRTHGVQDVVNIWYMYLTAGKFYVVINSQVKIWFCPTKIVI